MRHSEQHRTDRIGWLRAAVTVRTFAGAGAAGADNAGDCTSTRNTEGGVGSVSTAFADAGVSIAALVEGTSFTSAFEGSFTSATACIGEGGFAGVFREGTTICT